MSTTLKISYLRLLQSLKKESLVVNSVFGYPYRIRIGDSFSENPFYNAHANVGEVLACAAWVHAKEKPVIFDIGAHCGFISSQLAQILRINKPVIYSFEPVGPTFSDLVQTVDKLSLHEFIHPLPVALSDTAGFVKMSYSRWTSMLSQVMTENSVTNQPAGQEVYFAPSQTFDEFCKQTSFPDLIKIDVEGWEVHVFAGAKEFLSTRNEATGICLEWNPPVLEQTNSSVNELYKLLNQYRFFYINDYEGKGIPELQEIINPIELTHCCNLFALKGSDEVAENWKNSFRQLKQGYQVTVA